MENNIFSEAELKELKKINLNEVNSKKDLTKEFNKLITSQLANAAVSQEDKDFQKKLRTEIIIKLSDDNIDIQKIIDEIKNAQSYS